MLPWRRRKADMGGKSCPFLAMRVQIWLAEVCHNAFRKHWAAGWHTACRHRGWKQQYGVYKKEQTFTCIFVKRQRNQTSHQKWCCRDSIMMNINSSFLHVILNLHDLLQKNTKNKMKKLCVHFLGWNIPWSSYEHRKRFLLGPLHLVLHISALFEICITSDQQHLQTSSQKF